MSSQPLMRTEYWNVSTNTVRGGATAHGESLTDMENYVVPQAQMVGSSLYTWGVADGLVVTATPNQAGVHIAPGVALDAAGHLIALATNGFAIVDPTVDPNQVLNVPTVPVDGAGLALDTSTSNGDCYLTLTWREVVGQSQLANAPVMIHAPWVRLIAVGGFQDNGEQVVLAKVTLDANGQVTALNGELRRLSGVPAGRIELRHVRVAGLSVDQVAGGALQARIDGGLEVSLPAGAPLEIDKGSADDPALRLTSSGPGWGSGLQLSNTAANGQVYGTYTGSDGKWHFVDALNNTDRLIINTTGNLGIGTAQPGAALEIDKGATNDLALRLTSSGPGWGSGLQLNNTAANAQAYGTYAGSDGKWHFADVAHNVDRLVIDQAGNLGIGIGAGGAQRIVHVEGSEIHSGGAGGGFSFMSRGTQGFVNVPGAGERWVWYALDGTARLWSGGDKLLIHPTKEGYGLDVARRMRVRQGGDGSAGMWLFQTGPQADRAFVGMADDNHVGFWGNSGPGWGMVMNTVSGDVGIGLGTGAPAGRLDVRGAGTAISAHGGSGIFSSGVFAEGNIGVWGSGKGTGVMGVSTNNAGSFIGNVSITRDLSVGGTLTKGGGGFKIDHPLDPENKFLSHSFVESPDMMTVYNGNATTGDNGEATVELPGYFTALNRDYRYQLTVIGPMAQAAVKSEIEDNRFTIQTDKPGVKVSWQVTGIRQDPVGKRPPHSGRRRQTRRRAQPFPASGGTQPAGDSEHRARAVRRRNHGAGKGRMTDARTDADTVGSVTAGVSEGRGPTAGPRAAGSGFTRDALEDQRRHSGAPGNA